MAVQQPGNGLLQVQQALQGVPRQAAFAGQLQLPADTLVAEEYCPVLRPGIALRAGADGVVPLPAERLCGAAVHGGQLFAQQRAAIRPGGGKRDALQRQPTAPPGDAPGDRPRRAHAGAGEDRRQPGCLGGEHLQPIGAVEFDEQGAVAPLDPESLIDTAAPQGPAFAGGKRLAQRPRQGLLYLLPHSHVPR